MEERSFPLFRFARKGEELQGEIKSAHKQRCPDAISLCTGEAIIKEPLHVALLHGLQAIAHFTRHHHRHFRIDLPTSIRIRRRLFKWINPLDVSINSGVRSVIGNTSVEYEFSFDPFGSFPREKKKKEKKDGYSSLILIIRISLYLLPLKLIFDADLEAKRKCFSIFGIFSN